MVSRNPNHGILENSHSQADMGNNFEENNLGMEDSKNTTTSITEL